MSGALSNNLIFPTYGQRFKLDTPPPALTYTMTWLASSPPASNMIFHDGTWGGCAAGYEINLGNVVRSQSRLPIVQSIYIDNSRNPIDVYVDITDTQTSFMAPAYSIGMYPLICGQSPVLTFKVLRNKVSTGSYYPIVCGPTHINIFAEAMPVFCFKNQESGHTIGTDLQFFVDFSSGFRHVIIPPNATSFDPTFGLQITSTANMYPIYSALTHGRIVMRKFHYEVSLAFPSKSAAAVSTMFLCLCEISFTSDRLHFACSPIFYKRLYLDPAMAAGIYLQLPPVDIEFDPAYIGVFAVNPNALDYSSGSALYAQPGLAWCVSQAPTNCYVEISSVGTLADAPPSAAPFLTPIA